MASSRSEENVVLTNTIGVSVKVYPNDIIRYIDMVMFILADVMPFNVWISLIDVIIKVCVEDVIPHWQMLLPYEMVLPHLLDICGFYFVYGRCYCHFILVADVIARFVLLVVDGKTTCFVSSIMADVLPWWLMLLPLSCKIIYDGWCYCHGSCCYCYFFCGWCYYHSGWCYCH